MDKRHFSYGIFNPVLFFSFLCFLGYSCIDNRYDLNKDISTSAGMDGELGFPLGETEEKTLRDLLSSEDIADLEVMDDGAYGIHKKDVITATIDNFSKLSSINQILAYTKEFDITFKNVTLDPIQIAGDTWPVALNNSGVNIPQIAFSFKDANSGLSTDHHVPVSIPSGDVPPFTVSLSPQPAAFTIADFDCSPEISSISSLQFEGTDNAEIEWDLSALQQELSLSGGSVKAKQFQINFPSGFVLSNPAKGRVVDGNKLSLDGETLAFGKNRITFTIERYNHTFKNQDGRIAGVEENITFGSGGDGDMSIEISGVTSGIAAGNHTLPMPLSLSASLAVNDMNLTLENLKVDYAGLEVKNDPIKVTGIHEQVSSINQIDFVENTTLTVESAPLGLGSLKLEGQDVFIDLSSRFIFDETDGNWQDGRLRITPEEIKNGFSKPLKVLAMNLQGVTLYRDEETSSKWFEFEPEVTVSPATLYISGETVYSSLRSSGNNEMELCIRPSLFAIEDGECVTEVYTTRLEENAEFDVVDIDLPEEIEDLGWITFKDPKAVKMDITINNIPSNASDLYFQTVYLDFPDFLDLSENGEPLPLYQDEDGSQYRRLVLSGKEGLFEVQGNVRYWSNDKRLTISGLDLRKVENLKIENGKMSFTELAKVNGVVVLDRSTLELSDLNGRVINGQASVAVDEQMEIGVVAGRISSSAVGDLDLHTSVSLGDLSEYLGAGSKLYLPRVNFKIQAFNPLGVGVDCDLVFSPYKGGRPVFADAPSVAIFIDAYDHVEDTENIGMTNLMIVGKEYPEDIPAPEGYEKVVFERLSDVLLEVPDSVVIEARPRIAAPLAGEWHEVNLARESNDVTFDYEIGVPFVLGEGIQIVYRDTISDIQDDLSDILSKVSVSELVLNVKVTNGIPLNLKLYVTPLGPDSKNSAEGLKVLFNDDSKGNIAAGSYNFETGQTAPAESVVQIRIVDETPGSKALRQLDGLDLRIEGGIGEDEGTEGGIPLKPEQSIKAKVALRVKGLEADIDNF